MQYVEEKLREILRAHGEQLSDACFQEMARWVDGDLGREHREGVAEGRLLGGRVARRRLTVGAYGWADTTWTVELMGKPTW